MNTSNIIIPKIFHFIWLGDKKLSEEHIEFINTWKTNHLDWEIKIWKDDNIFPLQNQVSFDASETM